MKKVNFIYCLILLAWSLRAQTDTTLQLCLPHYQPITAMVFSPDGRYLVTGSGSAGNVKLWDTETWRLVKTLESARKLSGAMAFSPDSRWLAASVGQDSVQIFDMQDGRMVHVFPVTGGVDMVLTYSPDGHLLAVGNTEGKVQLIEMPSGIVRQTLKHEQIINALNFSPDGKQLLTSIDFGRALQDVKLWDTETGQAIDSLFLEREIKSTAFFSKDGSKIWVLGDRGNLYNWLPEQDTAIRFVLPTMQLDSTEYARQIHENTKIESVELMPNGNLAVIPYMSGWRVILELDAQNGQWVRLLGEFRMEIFNFQFSPDGRIIAAIGSDESIEIKDATTGNKMTVIPEHIAGISDLTFSPDSRFLAVGGEDAALSIWDLPESVWVQSFKGHSRPVTAVRYTPNGQSLVSASTDHSIRVWNIANGTQRYKFASIKSGVNTIDLRKDCHCIAAGSNDGTILLHDFEDQKKPRALNKGKSATKKVLFRSDGSQLASINRNENILLWNLKKCSKPLVLDNNTRNSYRMSYSPDGKILATSKDNHIYFWDTDNGKSLAQIETKQADCTGLSFNPDGRSLAAAYSEGHLLICDVDKQSITKSVTAHVGGCTALAYSPDGKWIATGGNDNLVHLWDAQTAALLLTLVFDKPLKAWVALRPSDRAFRCNEAGRNLLQRFEDGHPRALDEDQKSAINGLLGN